MRELLSEYRHEYDILFNEYELMGVLLNHNQILQRIKDLKIESCYIYGGGFLGIQCYRSICEMTEVKGIVDKSGGLKFNLPEIRVVDMDTFKNSYAQDMVIITPVKYASEIYKELIEFIQDDRLLFLGEFVLGDVG